MNRIMFQAAISCFALVIGLEGAAAAATAADPDNIGATIKAQVRDVVMGINTQNANLATAHDAPNVVAVYHGTPNVVGVAADLADFKKTFAAEPSWRVSLVKEAVDVPHSGDMAVYRSIYNQDSTRDNLPLTQKVNFISGWSRHENGAWLMDWYVVSEMEKSHKK